MAEIASAEILVVKQDGGGQFTQIQDAVNYASDGDVLLVYPGAHPYDFFSIDGKALLVRGISSSWISVRGASVANLPAGKFVGLENLMLRGDEVPGVVASNNQGSVGIYGCWIFTTYIYNAGLRVISSSDMTVVDSKIQGSARANEFDVYGADGGPGIWISENSSLAMYGSTSTGGKGSDVDCFSGCFGGDGGAGVLVEQDSMLFLSNSTAQGGNGGSAVGFAGEDGDGGDGLVVLDPSQAFVLEGVLQGGDSGLGSDGRPWVGNVQFLPDTAPKLRILSSFVSQGKVRLQVEGTPGEDVFVLYSGKTQFKNFLSSLRGILHVRDVQGVYAGVIPADGTLEVYVSLPPALPSQIHLQAISIAIDHGRTLSNPVAPVVRR